MKVRLCEIVVAIIRAEVSSEDAASRFSLKILDRKNMARISRSEPRAGGTLYSSYELGSPVLHADYLYTADELLPAPAENINRRQSPPSSPNKVLPLEDAVPVQIGDNDLHPCVQASIVVRNRQIFASFPESAVLSPAELDSDCLRRGRELVGLDLG